MIKFAIFPAILLIVSAFVRWAFLPTRNLPGNRVRIRRAPSRTTRSISDDSASPAGRTADRSGTTVGTGCTFPVGVRPPTLLESLFLMIREGTPLPGRSTGFKHSSRRGCSRTRKVSVLGTLRMSVLWC